MTTAYTPILKLALPQTGELSGTWGTIVNDNITSMVEQAVAGLATINTWTTNAHTLTTADGTTAESRCAMLVAADGAGGTALTGAGQIICPAASKLYVLKNGSSYAVTLKTSGGTGVAVPAGDTAFLFCDGTNVNSCVTTVVDGHISGNLTVDGNTTLGNANTDTVTVNAQFNTDLLPSTDNARDLGSTAKSWRTLYCDTSVLTPLVQVTNIKANDGTAAMSIADSTGAVTVSTILNVDNLRLDGNTISSTDSNGNITLAPNGTGDVYVDADTVRIGDSNANATLTTNGTGDLILNTNAGTNSGSITIADGADGNITIATNGAGVTEMTTAVTMSATTQNIALGTSQTSGTFTVGGAAQTGTQTFDQSTKTHTLNIGAGATENAATKTVNLATAGVSGSTTTMSVGSAVSGAITNLTVNATTTLAPVARSTGAVSYFTVTTPADTGLTASTEVIGSSFTAATRTWATGALTLQRERVFAAPTYAFAGASTLTTAVNVDIGLPVAGTNATITNAYALRAADSLFTGPTIVDVNSASAALRITQVGAGNALLVEDSTNPDSTPFVVTAAGDVGIGTNTPTEKLDVLGNITNTGVATFGTSGSNTYVSLNNNGYLRCDIANWFTLQAGTNGYQWRNSANSATAQMTLDSSGNLGLGVTPSAWTTYTALQISTNSSIASYTNGETRYSSNAYYNSGAWKYITSSQYASAYTQGAGAHTWLRSTSAQVAGTDPVFDQSMTLDASGNLGIGTTNPAARLNVSSTGDMSGLFETTGTSNAAAVFARSGNGTTSGLYAYARFVNYDTNAQDWRIGTYGNNNFSVYNAKAATTPMVLDTSGNLGLGVTPSAWGGFLKAFQIGSTSCLGLVSEGDDSSITTNAYKNTSGTWVLQTTSSYKPTRYHQFLGKHIWSYGASGSANDAASFTEAMTLDASGNLSVGTTSTYGVLTVEGANTSDGATTKFTANLRNSGAQTSGVGTGIAFSQKFSSFYAVLGVVEAIKENATTDNYASAMRFSTRANGVDLVERARITSSGDVEVTTGNLVIKTSGKGIDFSATAGPTNGTMTSELLSDYEEGTWTPGFGTGWTTAPSVATTGTYVKIGKQVTVSVYLLDGVSTAGALITGLPFTVGVESSMTGFSGTTSTAPLMTGVTQGGTTQIRSIPAATMTGLYWTVSTTYFV